MALFYLSPASPKEGGAKTDFHQPLTWKLSPIHRTETKTIPSPFGEGQTDLFDYYANQGEVQRTRLS